MDIKFSEFDVVILEVIGDLTTTTCYKNYSDYVKDKTDVCDHKFITQTGRESASFSVGLLVTKNNWKDVVFVGSEVIIREANEVEDNTYTIAQVELAAYTGIEPFAVLIDNVKVWISLENSIIHKVNKNG